MRAERPNCPSIPALCLDPDSSHTGSCLVRPPQGETTANAQPAATPDHHRTPHDKLDAVAEERLGRPFDELSGREKQSVGGAVGGSMR
jgi:hypothetical protein